MIIGETGMVPQTRRERRASEARFESASLHHFPIPVSAVDRELDALIEQSREQRRVWLDAPVWCLDAFGREYNVVEYEAELAREKRT